jgi:hypothetical protein
MVMGDVDQGRSPVRAPPPGRPARTGWWAATLAGAVAFWSANVVISLTPTAGAYRSALSIAYVPMLVEAAVGGLLIAGAVAFLLTRLSARVPGGGPMGKALVLALAALVLMSVLVEVPAKMRAGVADAGHWLLVATIFNVIRIFALGVSVGLVVRAGTHPAGAGAAT